MSRLWKIIVFQRVVSPALPLEWGRSEIKENREIELLWLKPDSLNQQPSQMKSEICDLSCKHSRRRWCSKRTDFSYYVGASRPVLCVSFSAQTGGLLLKADSLLLTHRVATSKIWRNKCFVTMPTFWEAVKRINWENIIISLAGNCWSVKFLFNQF